jgi:hypothetical protein
MGDGPHGQSTERTPQGREVPIPRRREFFGNLKKAARPDPPKEADSRTRREPDDASDA